MFRGFGRGLEGGSGEGIQSGRNRFFDGLGGGSWEGKNQRNPMKGSLILSLRVGADKRDWALKSDRNVCTGYIFVKILSPQKRGPAEASKRGPWEGVRGVRGQGEALP